MKNLDLKTKRVQLRIFKTEDITPEYVKALNSAEIIGLTESRYRSWNLDEVKQYVKEKANIPDESILVGIFVKGERHIGNIRLHSFSKFNKRVEVGILIWDKNEWGKGYATESLEELIDFLFENWDIHKVCAEYYSINEGSKKIFEKLGFKKEGIFKDHFLVNGKFVDAIRIAKFNPRG